MLSLVNHGICILSYHMAGNMDNTQQFQVIVSLLGEELVPMLRDLLTTLYAALFRLPVRRALGRSIVGDGIFGVERSSATDLRRQLGI